MKNELIIASYGSHNAAVAMFYKGTYTVIEVERWLSKKNAGLITYLPASNPNIILEEITEFLLSKTDRSEVDLYLTNYGDLSKLKPSFNYVKSLTFDHHEAHAACAFYQSPFDKALTFTFDGGGDAGYFNVYMTDRQNGVTLLNKFNQDLGFAYMILGDHLDEITRDPLNIGNLVYAGKLMGLCSYGNIRDEWIPHFTEFYETFTYSGDSYLGGAEAAKDALPKLMEAIQVKNYTKDTRISGQMSWDIAATTQHVFEEQFFKFAQPYFDQYPDIPVTLAGGCALNVILNTRILRERGKNVFIPPNTSDCGIAVGGILLNQKPEYQVDLTYAGAPVLDEHMFSSYIENGMFSVVEDVSIESLANYINNGHIVGIINGNSEHGPRALGNRSIICNPVGDMKNILNDKVKNREWYRPFAPLVRLEDAPTYFDFPEGAQSRHMTYVAEVREEYRDIIPAVTHEDNTGRLQTVTRQQNSFIYDLLTEFDKVSDHSVLLNTSFNVNGKPILTRISEALEILETSKLDAVFYKNRLIFRRGEEKKFEKKSININIKPLSNETTVNIFVTPTNNDNLLSAYIPKISKICQDSKVVLIIEEKYIKYCQLALSDFEVEYFPINITSFYYHELVQKSLPNLNMVMSEYLNIIRMLWAKNVMLENLHRTQNHIFVTLGNVMYSMDIVNDIKTISEACKEGDQIITTSRTYTGSPAEDILGKHHIGKVPTKIPSMDIVAGHISQIDWLCTNIEAHLLSMLRSGGVSSDYDYVVVPFMESNHKFRLI
jgi:carbamoyltransferase